MIIAGLLQDALVRLENQDPNNWLLSRLILQKGHSVALMEDWLNSHQQKPEAIYLDPMFPHRKKSALVKKEMQALQIMSKLIKHLKKKQEVLQLLLHT